MIITPQFIAKHYFHILSFDDIHSYPIGAGSGFMLNLKSHTFFITADHVIHPADHENVQVDYSRIADSKSIAIINNVDKNRENGSLCPIISPIGGFYYFDKISYAKGEAKPVELFDGTFCILNEKTLSNAFLTRELVDNKGNIIIGKGIHKEILDANNVTIPSKDHKYFTGGCVCHHFNQNKFLDWKFRFHMEMKYLDEKGDFYVFEPKDQIINSEWSGISGSAVYDENCNLIGILCSGIPSLHTIYVMSIYKVITLMKYALQIEKLGDKNT